MIYPTPSAGAFQFGTLWSRTLGLLVGSGLGLVPATAIEFHDHGNPTDEEQLFLELVNNARLDPAGVESSFGIALDDGLSSGEISTLPKPPLATNLQLVKAARGHTDAMLVRGFFDHVDPEGHTPGDRVLAAGYDWHYVGENIGVVATSLDRTVESFIHQIFGDLYRSPSHRRKTFSTTYNEIGVGFDIQVSDIKRDDWESAAITADFAENWSKPLPKLVGVIYNDDDGDGAYSMTEGIGRILIQRLDGTYYTGTGDAGGYSLPLPRSGIVDVLIKGSGIDTVFRVASDGENRKLDLVTTPDGSHWIPHQGYGWMACSDGSWFWSEDLGWLWSYDLEWTFSVHKNGWVWSPMNGRPGEVFVVGTGWEKIGRR